MYANILSFVGEMQYENLGFVFDEHMTMPQTYWVAILHSVWLFISTISLLQAAGVGVSLYGMYQLSFVVGALAVKLFRVLIKLLDFIFMAPLRLLRAFAHEKFTASVCSIAETDRFHRAAFKSGTEFGKGAASVISQIPLVEAVQKLIEFPGESFAFISNPTILYIAMTALVSIPAFAWAFKKLKKPSNIAHEGTVRATDLVTNSTLLSILGLNLASASKATNLVPRIISFLSQLRRVKDSVPRICKKHDKHNHMSLPDSSFFESTVKLCDDCKMRSGVHTVFCSQASCADIPSLDSLCDGCQDKTVVVGQCSTSCRCPKCIVLEHDITHVEISVMAFCFVAAAAWYSGFAGVSKDKLLKIYRQAVVKLSETFNKEKVSGDVAEEADVSYEARGSGKHFVSYKGGKPLEAMDADGVVYTDAKNIRRIQATMGRAVRNKREARGRRSAHDPDYAQTVAHFTWLDDEAREDEEDRLRTRRSNRHPASFEELRDMPEGLWGDSDDETSFVDLESALSDVKETTSSVQHSEVKANVAPSAADGLRAQLETMKIENAKMVNDKTVLEYENAKLKGAIREPEKEQEKKVAFSAESMRIDNLKKEVAKLSALIVDLKDKLAESTKEKAMISLELAQVKARPAQSTPKKEKKKAGPLKNLSITDVIAEGGSKVQLEAAGPHLNMKKAMSAPLYLKQDGADKLVGFYIRVRDQRPDFTEGIVNLTVRHVAVVLVKAGMINVTEEFKGAHTSDDGFDDYVVSFTFTKGNLPDTVPKVVPTSSGEILDRAFYFPRQTDSKIGFGKVGRVTDWPTVYVGDYDSIPGDSGSAVFVNDSTGKLITVGGLHGGSVPNRAVNFFYPIPEVFRE
jgi:regulator of replication initiation timing